MNSFKSNSQFEDGFTERLLNALEPIFAGTNKMITRFARSGQSAKTDLDPDLQKAMGDLQVVDLDDRTYLTNIDLKVERKRSKHMFFEEFSNAVSDPKWNKVGWGLSIKVDKIWYAFEDVGALAIIDLRKLRVWLDEVSKSPSGVSKLRRMTYKECMQSQHAQLNRTTGRLIPFADIPAEAWSRGYVLEGSTARVIAREEFLNLVCAPRS